MQQRVEVRHTLFESEREQGADPEDPDEYRADNISSGCRPSPAEYISRPRQSNPPSANWLTMRWPGATQLRHLAREAFCSILCIYFLQCWVLKNKEFKLWIDAELKGYDNADNLPDYRKIAPVNLGTFSGPFGKMANNIPIPVALLPENIREFAKSMKVLNGVREIEASADQAAQDDRFRSPWPPEAVILARDHRCFIRELLLTFSLSSTTCDSAWVSRGFSVIKHV